MRIADLQLINTWHKDGKLFDANGRINTASIIAEAENNPTLYDILTPDNPTLAIQTAAAKRVIISITDDNGGRLYYKSRGEQYRPFAEVHPDRGAYNNARLLVLLRQCINTKPGPDILDLLNQLVTLSEAEAA